MKIAILGLGWLGEALAFHLKKQGHQVIGTYRHQVSSFSESFPLALPLTQTPHVPTDFLTADVLIGTLAPSKNSSSLLELYQNFFRSFDGLHAWSQIFLCTSTAVYADDQGVVDESAQPLGEGVRAHRQREVEQWAALQAGEFTCLRLAGLSGPRRHPLKSLAGREIAQNGRLNLISQIDLLRGIEFLLGLPRPLPPVIHFSSPYHPAKDEYYVRLAHRLGLRPPRYNGAVSDSAKQVHPGFLLEHGFQFFDPKCEDGL